MCWPAAEGDHWLIPLTLSESPLPSPQFYGMVRRSVGCSLQMRRFLRFSLTCSNGKGLCA